MPVIDEDAVRSLAAVRTTAPITSCYLDVDGRRHHSHQDVEHELAMLMRQARAAANGDLAAVEEDLSRIERHVKGGFDRSGVRGLAMFSCAADDWWHVVPLAVPVRSQLVVRPAPYVRQLEWVVSRYERFGVLLVDKQRARMFVFELGELVDRSELFDQLPRHDDDGGEWDKDHVADHVEAAAASHIRRAAEVALHVYQDQGFDHLIVGAGDETASRLSKALHPYLAERLVARVSIAITASVAEVTEAAMEVEAKVEADKNAALVARLRDAAGAGSGGVTGLPDVLAAVSDRRVETLLVSRGFVAEGWRCASCGRLAAVGPGCPACTEPMQHTTDVVEDAIEEAMAQSCRVEICEGVADLDVVGQIGALLRF